MNSRSTFITLLFIAFGLLGSISSCDLINPEEQIPSFLCIDTIAINPISQQGTDDHNIVDAWVFENEQLIGVYELPAVVPILKTGESNIRIRPGVKINGLSASRWRFEFLEDYVGTVELFEDSVVCVNPTLPFKSNVVIPWVEDFESSSLMSLTSTNLSEQNVLVITGEEAYEGRTALLRLPAGETIFECKSAEYFPLPDAGASVILEFTYKCNHPFQVGLFSSNSTGSVQTPILLLNESEEWNHVYVGLTQITSAIFTATGHSPYFGFIRDGSTDGDINVYIDNIRLLHF